MLRVGFLNSSTVKIWAKIAPWCGGGKEGNSHMLGYIAASWPIPTRCHWWWPIMSPALPPWASKSAFLPTENHRLKGSRLFFFFLCLQVLFFLNYSVCWEMFQTSFRHRRNSRADCSPTECERIASINITNNVSHVADRGVLPFEFHHR